MLLLGLLLTVAMVMPSLAAEMRARIKAVNANNGIITVVEGQKDYNFTTTADTQFLNLKGGALANGIKSGDLREGRRVVVHYDTKDGQMVLTSLKIRP